MSPDARFSPVRLWHVIRKEFKQLLRDPRARPLLLAAPVMQFLLLGYASTTDVETIRTLVVDQDRTPDSRALIQAYQATEYFQIREYADRPERLADALDRGEVMVGLMIPPGFSSDLRSGRGATIQALIDGSDASVATVAQSYVSQIASAFGARASNSLRSGGVEPRSRAWFNPSLKSRLFNVPATIGTLVMITCLMLTTMSVVRERETGTLDQLLVSPVKPIEIMLGKMAPVLTVSLGHVAVFTSITLFHFMVPLRGSVLDLALAAVLFVLAALSLGMALGSLSSTQQEAFMMMILGIFPAVLLSGFLSPVDSMPRSLQWLAAINPIRHFLDIVRGVFLKGTGVAELWPQYAILAATLVLALGFATRRFRQSIA
jgi:ABC-2 type transport system permease protein